ncbi:MAG: hypothetical protein QW404_01855 [Candidatus Nanoarchaeia archaeon]
MELKENKPKIAIKKGHDYFEAKTSKEDLEAILDGADRMNKYQIKGVVDNLQTGKKIDFSKYNLVGRQLPLSKPIMAFNGIVERQKIVSVLEEFFHSAVSYAQVYNGVYVVIDRIGIYDLGHGEETVYYVSGLAQLMREKQR